MKLSEAIERLEDLAVGIDSVVCGETNDGRLTVYPEQAKAIDVVSDALRRHKWPEEKSEKGQLCLTKDPNLKYYRVQCYAVAFSDIVVEIEGEVGK